MLCKGQAEFVSTVGRDAAVIRATSGIEKWKIVGLTGRS